VLGGIEVPEARKFCLIEHRLDAMPPGLPRKRLDVLGGDH
jgi:hypothetical protein